MAASLVEVAAGLVDGEVFLDVLHWTRLTYTESCTTETETETETETRSTSTNRMCADVQKWGWKKILVLCYPRQKRAGKRKSTTRTQPLPDRHTHRTQTGGYIYTHIHIHPCEDSIRAARPHPIRPESAKPVSSDTT